MLRTLVYQGRKASVLMRIRALLVLSLSCLSSCSIFSQKHDDYARMIGNLQGGSTPDAAKKQLKYLGFSGWGERTLNNTSVLAVRFSDLGVAGDLELKFYNDRLMVAQFDPDDPSRYMSLLTEQVGTFSSGAPAHSKQISSEVSSVQPSVIALWLGSERVQE
jgi:hypothetical protein